MPETNNRSLFSRWVWRMAWRDSRTHRKRLLLFTTAIVLGIAALVAIGSFGQNLEQAIDQQAKSLLGADLMLSSRQPFNPEMQTLIDSLGGEQAREIMLATMAYFPKSNGTRLVQVRGLDGDFPFYGKFGTEPADAVGAYKSGKGALVDEVLLFQFDAAVGDSVRLGNRSFEIVGKIISLPSNPPIASTFNPRIYVPRSQLETTGLIQAGSLVRHRIYFKFADDRNVEQMMQTLDPVLDAQGIRDDTVAERKEDVGEVMENLYRFLNLVGFVALILGSIGVASAVHVHTKQKIEHIAVLRCLGATAKQTFAIYLIQVLAIAVIGAGVGALLGIGIQTLLPEIFRAFLPVSIEHFIAWSAVFQGIAVGLGIALLFALLPLISIRRISPLLAIRASYNGVATKTRDKLRLLIFGLIGVGITLFAVAQSHNWIAGLSFALAIFIAFGVLSGVAKGITVFFKKFFPRSWTYVWRQGLANLYRPNNQTWVLMLAIGLGTFLITTLYLTRGTLLQQVTFAGGGDRPNLILFDIQPDQLDPLRELIRAENLPILQEAPIVTMRIDSVKGRSAEELMADSTWTGEDWILNREFRSTYRDSLLESETILAGAWQGRVKANARVVPVSLEQEAAEELAVTIGDTIVWDVQGVPVASIVGSLRKVDWQRIQANFFAVFPEGALEAAPQIYILATRAESAQASAALQRNVVQAFPGVSMIDLALVLNTLDDFLDKIAFVIRFMAFFSIFTGLIVLTSAVITSRYQRVQESVLLRTLGASRQQIRKIMVIEYIFLGGFAALTGLLLSYLGGWALAYFAFDSVFVPTILPFVVTLLVVIGLTVLIGMSNSRGILGRPPLEVLRAEG